MTSALVAAREARTSNVDMYLAEARSLAAHTGERNHLRYHFGPTNVAGWELSSPERGACVPRSGLDPGSSPALADRPG